MYILSNCVTCRCVPLQHNVVLAKQNNQSNDVLPNRSAHKAYMHHCMHSQATTCVYKYAGR